MLIYRVVLKKIFGPVLDLIYPKNCLICHNFPAEINTDNPVCFACWDKIERNLPPFCTKCGRHTEEPESLCRACQKRELGFTRAFSVVNYTGAMRHLLHLFKYKNKTSLAKPFAALMADFFERYNLSRFKFDNFLSVPLHPTRLREREYNQSELLCEEMEKLLGIKNLTKNLKRIKHTAFQSSLNEDMRLNNTKGAFELKNPQDVFKKNILLIDDLLTTGATCSEAANIFKKSGANEIYVLTLATTP